MQVVHRGLTIPDEALQALNAIVAQRLSDSEIYEGRWVGLGELVPLEGSVHLPNILWEVEEEFGRDLDAYPPQELVTAFRRAWENAMMCGPGYFCRSIQGGDRETAWLGFRQGDAGVVDVVGAPSVRGGASVRGMALLPGHGGEAPVGSNHRSPHELASGKLDGYTDEEVLQILAAHGGMEQTEGPDAGGS